MPSSTSSSKWVSLLAFAPGLLCGLLGIWALDATGLWQAIYLDVRPFHKSIPDDAAQLPIFYQVPSVPTGRAPSARRTPFSSVTRMPPSRSVRWTSIPAASYRATTSSLSTLRP